MIVVVYLLAILFGLIVGSFLSVVISRLPVMLNRQWQHECQAFLNQTINKDNQPFNLSLPRSHCPNCKNTIVWWQNIPIVSYFLLKGKCAHCQTKIPLFYPLLEVCCAILTVWVIAHFGLTAAGFMALLLTYALIALSLIDWKTQLLPDEITLPFIWIGLLTNLFYVYVPPSQAILGAILGYGILWVIANAYKLIRHKDGMGYGDFKLLAMLGAWLGPLSVINILMLGCFIGLAASLALLALKKMTRDNPFAFGPYLAIAGWLTLLYGPFLLKWIGIY